MVLVKIGRKCNVNATSKSIYFILRNMCQETLHFLAVIINKTINVFVYQVGYLLLVLLRTCIYFSILATQSNKNAQMRGYPRFAKSISILLVPELMNFWVKSYSAVAGICTVLILLFSKNKLHTDKLNIYQVSVWHSY